MPSDRDRDRDISGSPWSSHALTEEAVPGSAIPPSRSLATEAGAVEGIMPSGGEATSTGGQLRQIVSVFTENKLAVAGLVVIIGMVLFCFVGPFFYHTNQTNAQASLLNSTQNTGPGAGHPFGTDSSGFDVLGRIMFGGRNSLIVGFAAAVAATLLGVVYGAVSGFLGGWIDALMMRLVDVLLSIPQLFLLIVLAVIFKTSLGLLIFVIAFVSWLVPARLIRGETLTLRVREYVQAVKVMGGSRKRIVLRHIIPNTVGTIVVNATFQVADAILLISYLGFLGLGLPIPQTDWGSMLNTVVSDAGNGFWWKIYPVGIAIVLVVVAFNFVGDALRDSLEVRLQRR
jgi:peptide/nickel transport system permease protein